MDRCIVCHRSGGSAGTTRLVYEASSAAGYLDNNYDVLAAYVSGGNGATLLGKMSGTQSHGGGRIYGVGTDEYAAFEEFVRLVEEEDASGGEEPEPVTNAFNTYFKSSTLLSAEATLRRATILLLGRNPNPSEISLLGDGSDAALRQAIRAATEDPAFHDFLVRGANDRLLTDAFVEGIPLEQASLEGNAFYPLGTNAHADAQADAGNDSFTGPNTITGAGALRAPHSSSSLHCEQRSRLSRSPYCRLHHDELRRQRLLNGGAEFDEVDPETSFTANHSPTSPVTITANSNRLAITAKHCLRRA